MQSCWSQDFGKPIALPVGWFCCSAPRVIRCCLIKVHLPHTCTLHLDMQMYTQPTFSTLTKMIHTFACLLFAWNRHLPYFTAVIFRAYVHYIGLLFESSGHTDVTLWNCSKISIFFWALDIYSLIFKACNLLSKLHSTVSASWANDLTFMNLSSFHSKRFCLDMKHLSMIRQISATSKNHCKKGYKHREI